MRKAISFRLKKAIFERDNYKCNICGATNRETRLEVDHIIPISRGGTNDYDNLVTLCIECNRGKSDNLMRVPKKKNILQKLILKQEVNEKREMLENIRVGERETESTEKKIRITLYKHVYDEFKKGNFPSLKLSKDISYLDFVKYLNRLLNDGIETFRASIKQTWGEGTLDKIESELIEEGGYPLRLAFLSCFKPNERGKAIIKSREEYMKEPVILERN